MARLKILTYPDPRLNMISEPVAEVDGEIKRLIEDMAETMYDSPSGVGLAAPQVGVNKRVIICDVNHRVTGERALLALINPEIVEADGELLSEEGCLSCPEMVVEVPRAEYIKVEALDAEGRPVTIETDDFLAVVIQHETDHLDGRLIVNNLSSLKRKLYRRKLKKIQEEAS